MAVGEMASPLPPISPEITCSEALRRIQTLGAQAGLAVVDTDRVVGLAGRSALMHQLAHPVTYALYEQRPIRLLMRHDPLIVDASTSVDRVNELIATEKQWALEEGFVVTRNGAYTGVGTIQDLLKQSVSDARQKIADLDAARREAERANEAKSTFLANLSHELRTPLNAILGFADLLNAGGAGPITAKQQEYLKDIHTSGRHLLNLINDLLDLSRAESGRLKLDAEPVELADVLYEGRRLLSVRAEENGVTLTSAIAARPRVRGDERKLLQIILNLGTNAIKFTPQGGHVTMEVHATADGGTCIVVQDTGPGIPEAEIPRVLEPFGRGQDAQTRRAEGAGIGLALVKTLTELHDGRLELTSTVGEGTRVTAHLPESRVLCLDADFPPQQHVANG